MEKNLQINFGIDINTINQLKAIAELRNVSQSEYLGSMISINDLNDKIKCPLRYFYSIIILKNH